MEMPPLHDGACLGFPGCSCRVRRFCRFGEYPPTPEVLKTLFVFKDSIGDVIDLRDIVQKEMKVFPIRRRIAILSIFFRAIGVHGVLQLASERIERGVDNVDGFVERITQRGEALHSWGSNLKFFIMCFAPLRVL